VYLPRDMLKTAINIKITNQECGIRLLIVWCKETMAVSESIRQIALNIHVLWRR